MSARASVITHLAHHTSARGVTFRRSQKKRSSGALTDGNLSRHLAVLEKDGMVEIVQGHRRRSAAALCRITAAGRKRYLNYLSTLEQVIRDAAKNTEAQPANSSLRKLKPLEALNRIFLSFPLHTIQNVFAKRRK